MKLSASVLLTAAVSSTSAFSVTSRSAVRSSTPSVCFSTVEKEETSTTDAINGAAFAVQVDQKDGSTSSAAATSPVVVNKETRNTAVAVAAPDTTSMLSQQDTTATPAIIDKSKIRPGRYATQEYSTAIPFLKRPPTLDGTHAGDFGFDPLGLSEEWDLYTMQESELRHARLAMLAVVGWPLSELVAPEWMLQEGGRAPSVLNGFNPISFFVTVAIFGALGFFEYKTALRRTDNTKLGKIHNDDMSEIWKYGVAGDYNFDPLNWYESIGNDAYARKGLRDVEISHGRAAMLGITAFVIWEFLTGHAIVENSMFFHPNALLPALVGAYLAFGQFYEFDEQSSDTFYRFKLSSEGEARMENLKMGLGIGREGRADDGTMGVLPDFDFSSLTDLPAKVTSVANGLKERIDKLQDSYMNNVVQPDKKD